VGKEVVRQFQNLPTTLGSIKLLRNVDCVKDRLASFFHWDDKQALHQALEVCLEQRIDFEELERWSIDEGFIHKFKNFLEAYHSMRES